jgi:hypothetical protein
MLRKSRQIYHESIGILYSANDFLISSSLVTHNVCMYQFETAETILCRLGGQLGLMKHLTIDISPLCHQDCEDDVEAQQRIDILPPLRMKWFYSSIDIGLKHTGRHMDSRLH